MKPYTLTAILVLFCMQWANLQINPEHFKEMKIRNIGPAGMSGRITAIDVDLQNPSRIFAGSASGGLWLSENGGISWKPVFDNEKTLAIGSVKINQNNPSEIWVGTGEGNPRNSLNTGMGIYKSLDGGMTWKHMGLENTKTIHRIIIHRDNPDIVYAAALGSPWGPNPERGVFKTTDGGKTWKNILFVNELTGAADMVVDPKNPNKIIAAMWEHQREPWFFKSGGKGSGLYITFDGGENWKKITAEDGLPEGELGRIGIAFAPSKPAIVYALVEAKENGLYKSVDGGKSWKLVSTKNIGDRPFYYAELYVDPLNENRIYNVYTYLSLSEDGGNTFRNIADYGNLVHPDHHAFWIHPQNPDFIIDGNDGGLNISRDRGETWQFAGNIPVGQFYHVNVDDDFPYNVYGGMQDNGSWIGPGFVLRTGGIRNHDFQEVYFGDGFDVAPYPADSRYGYAMSQGGNLAFYDKVTGLTSLIKPVHPDPAVKLRYNWNAPLAQDPFNVCGIYYGSQFVHYSADCGKNWKILSPDLTTNNPEKQKADMSGGLTPDATNAENHTTLLCIAPSPVDSLVVWTGSDDGQVHVTTDGGITWTNVSKNFKNIPEFSWIPQIEVSARSAGEAWVVVNNYRRNDYKPYLLHTNNFGKTWQQIVDETQVKGFVLSVVQDTEEPNLLFLGTDSGLYVSFDKGKKWTHWNKNLPAVQVNDMKIQKTFGDLVLGTFGRSFWVLDDIRPFRALAKKGQGILDSTFMAFGTPDAWLSSFTSYQGIRFIAQGEFVGDNKNVTQSNTYLWIKPQSKPTNSEEKKQESGNSEKGKKSKKDENKIKIEVFNQQGEKIRTFSRDYTEKEGIVSVSWNLRKDGIVYPRREKRKEDNEDLPSGRTVDPGTYKLLITYKNKKDSSMVNVLEEPRKDKFWPVTKNTDRITQLDSLVTRVNKEYNRLHEAKNTLDIVDKLLENHPDSTQKKYKEWHKKLRAEMDSIQHVFFNKENQKGIQRDPDVILAKLFTANNYVSTFWHGNEGNAAVALSHAQKAGEEGLVAIRTFFDEKWKPYREKAEKLDLILFKKE